MQVPHNYSLLLRGGRGVVTSRMSHPHGALSPRGSTATDHLSHQYDWGSAENRHRRTGIWSAQCEEITAVANDQVRRRKERRKALGALKAAMRKGDLVAAGQYQHLIEVYFGAR